MKHFCLQHCLHSSPSIVQKRTNPPPIGSVLSFHSSIFHTLSFIIFFFFSVQQQVLQLHSADQELLRQQAAAHKRKVCYLPLQSQI